MHILDPIYENSYEMHTFYSKTTLEDELHVTTYYLGKFLMLANLNINLIDHKCKDYFASTYL